MEYWIAQNKERKGPFSPEQLSEAGISPDTLVWRDGLTSWTKAEDLEELAWLFNCDIPPAIPTPKVEPICVQPQHSFEAPKPAAEPQPPTYIWWSVAALILCCTIPAIVALVMGSKVSSRYICGDYEGAKKASESAELWLIIAIVSGLVWLPFSVVLQLLSL